MGETVTGTARPTALAALALAALIIPAAAEVATPVAEPPALLGVPVEFMMFAAILLGVALYHHHTLGVALIGLAVVVAFKLAFTGFRAGAGLAGLALHMRHEWVVLANLFLLLMGFALLARHFEESKAPDILPAILPNDWTGGLCLLGLVFVLSAFLDNIAAALIGGTIANSVFRARVHIGFLAAIVAAANAGGAGSVVGDTTTTMMWIDGVSPLAVLDAYIAALAAVAVFGVPAALRQQAYQAIQKDPKPGVRVDLTRLAIVGIILAAAIITNVAANLVFPTVLDHVPLLGLAVWIVIVVTAPLRRPDWSIMPQTFLGTLFLLALVTTASLMPVEKLPAPAWQSTLGLGFLSAVFDNIPLTALALKQGGYDWSFLAYAVGFGGSMMWFGSSAGVALSNLFPEAKSAVRWLWASWHVVIGYVVGFFVMLALVGWVPNHGHKQRADPPRHPNGAVTSQQN